MSGLLYLTTEDFGIDKGQKGPILVTGIAGFSLILFYSNDCVHCKKLVPIFNKLPGSVGGCQFGIVNISKNRQIVNMSRQTINEIKYVPYVILYINGKPFMIYKGPSEEGEIKRFVLEVAGNVQKKQQFSKERVKETQDEPIPSYCIGKPVCGDKNNQVCYLEFAKYGDANAMGAQQKMVMRG